MKPRERRQKNTDRPWRGRTRGQPRWGWPNSDGHSLSAGRNLRLLKVGPYGAIPAISTLTQPRGGEGII